MSKYFIMTTNSAYYVLLQRTQYRDYIEHKIRNYGLKLWRNKYFIRLEGLFFKKIIGRLYYNEIDAEFNDIKTYLPDKVDNVLDIGCGIAGINIFINRHYSTPVQPFFTLLDKEGISNELFYGFRQDAAFYNNLELTKKFLTLNGIPFGKIRLINIDNNLFPSDIQYDLILSLLSWGFHYPVDVYLNQVFASLKKSGILIIDIRKDTDGESQLMNIFNDFEVIKTFEKHNRIKLKK